MKKSVVLASLMAALLVLGAGGLAYFNLQVPTADSAPAEIVSVDDVFLNEGMDEVSPLVQLLSATDSDWVRDTNSSLRDYVALMSESEENRRLLALQEAQVREQFLQQQEQVAKEQQELLDRLNRQALDAIIAEGGIDATQADEVELTPEMIQEIIRRRANGESLEGIVDNAVLDNGEGAAEDAVTGQPSDGEIRGEQYLGQFTAKFYCTCSECFDESEWRNVKTGDTYILADPEYISTGSQVTLSEGSVSVFEVRNGGDSVKGRNIIVFNSNHEEFNGDATMYPKVTIVG